MGDQEKKTGNRNPESVKKTNWNLGDYKRMKT